MYLWKKNIIIFLAALPRSVSTPGLLESRGRIPLEQMWVSPCPLNTGMNLNVKIFILKLQPLYSKIILRLGHTF